MSLGRDQGQCLANSRREVTHPRGQAAKLLIAAMLWLLSYAFSSLRPPRDISPWDRTEAELEATALLPTEPPNDHRSHQLMSREHLFHLVSPGRS